MIVDDDVDMREVAGTILETAGFGVLLADSIDAALKCLSEQIPHAVVLDLNMPNGSGFEFLEELKRLSANEIPVLIMSGSSDKSTVFRAIGLGAKDYVVKPMDAKTLVQKVRNVLRTTKLLRKKYPRVPAPLVRIDVEGELTRLGEIGFGFQGPIRFGSDGRFTFTSELLTGLKMEDAPLRTSRNLPKITPSGLYQNEVIFVGIDSASTQRIRSTIKDWK